MYFTTLNLSSGYYNIPMKEDVLVLTHIIGEFVRMPMGLSTVPANFQKEVLWCFIKKTGDCFIYLENIMILADDMEEHLCRMRIIIHEAGLKLSPDKCSLQQAKVPYLGYI